MTKRTPTPEALATDLPVLALRAAQAAKSLGIGVQLLWEKTNIGEIPHCRIGRAVVYPVHLLREYLDKAAKNNARR
jgi:hypothetical protein